MKNFFSRLLAAFLSVAMLVPHLAVAQVAIDPGARGSAVQAMRVATRADNAAILRALAAKAEAANPFELPPLQPPPLWQATTAYVAGDVVRTTAGRAYVCIGGGTTGSTEPTQEYPAGAPVDGTVYWAFYSGVSAATDPLNPTVSTGALGSQTSTIAGFTNPYYPAAQTSNFTLLTSTGFTVSNASLKPNGSSGRIAFETEASSFLIGYFYTTPPFRVIIDGRWRTLQAENKLATNAGGNFNYTKFDFSSIGGRKTRRIIIETANTSGNNAAILGVYVPTSEQVRPIGGTLARMVAITDSWGTSAEAGYITGGQFPNSEGDILGIASVDNLAIGGTGYINKGTGGAATNFVERVATVTNPLSVNLWRFSGSINDNGQSSIAISAAVQAAIAAVRATGSMAPIVIAGVQPVTSSGSVGTGNGALNEAAQLAGIAASGDKLTFYIPIVGDPSGPWISGTYNNASRPTFTNSGDLSNTTNHTYDKVYALWAKRIAAAIKATVYPKLGGPISSTAFDFPLPLLPSNDNSREAQAA